MTRCKGQMRTPARVISAQTPAGRVRVFVYVSPVCRAEYAQREAKPIHLVLKCSELAQERKKIAA